MTLPANKLVNVRRRAERSRRFGENTCPASRHVQEMADALVAGEFYHNYADEPRHCAESLYAVLESLWKCRTELQRIKGKKTANPRG